MFGHTQFEADFGFTVEGDVPLHVAQFLIVGTQAGGFSENWVVLGMPEGTSAWVDGASVDSSAGCDGPTTDGLLDGITDISWTCPISDGVHHVASAARVADATAPIAATVYGYYNAGSYEALEELLVSLQPQVYGFGMKFINTMAKGNLANPKKLHLAVPANSACGKTTEERGDPEPVRQASPI